MFSIFRNKKKTRPSLEKQHLHDTVHDGQIGQDLHVVGSGELLQVHRLLLLAVPVLAGFQRSSVDGTVAVTHHQRRLAGQIVRFFVV